MRCPKCAYTRQASDQQAHPGICPACGIAYAKWRARQKGSSTIDSDAAVGDEDYDSSLLERLRVTLTQVPEEVDPVHFWGRVILYLLFVIWGGSFIVGGIDWESIGGSFLHNANLPFHEFGHLLFSPLGDFMGILGGSLFQVLLPIGLMTAFVLQQQDNFAASIMLWWSGQNFIDVSPYIADAKSRAIPLIRGMSEDYHDWGNLLSMLV